MRGRDRVNELYSHLPLHVLSCHEGAESNRDSSANSSANSASADISNVNTGRAMPESTPRARSERAMSETSDSTIQAGDDGVATPGSISNTETRYTMPNVRARTRASIFTTEGSDAGDSVDSDPRGQ
jgi:hypothetical protein